MARSISRLVSRSAMASRRMIRRVLRPRPAGGAVGAPPSLGGALRASRAAFAAARRASRHAAYGGGPPSAPLLRHGAVHLALGLALGDGFTPVLVLAALGEPELHLRPSLLEVERERDEGVAALLHLASDLLDLLAVHEELAVAQRKVPEQGRRRVLADAAVDEEQLRAARLCVGVRQGEVSPAEGLHLAPGEREACLVGVLHLEVEAGPAVRRDHLHALGGLLAPGGLAHGSAALSMKRVSPSHAATSMRLPDSTSARRERRVAC